MPREIFDIFLSSTSADLQDCRAKVSAMIGRMRQTTIRMETFGAKPHRPLRTCREEVRRCDALIVIVGCRYGWVPSPEDGGDGIRSITWHEVQWALDAQKPVYAFLVDPRAPWIGEREQDRLTRATTDKMSIEIGRAVRRLREFRDFLETRTTRELFTSADDLASKVATSLHDWLLEQAIAAARSALVEQASQPLPALPGSIEGGGPLADGDALHWQEHVHLHSAHRRTAGAGGVQIALIAGRANALHPALSGASIHQLDARAVKSQAPADDFTTSLAALLVGTAASHPYVGVAKGADLLVLQILDDRGSARTSHLLAALDAAIRQGAQVVCLPLGGSSAKTVEMTAYRRALDLGVVVVCAAGNLASDQPVYPAAYPDCVSAAAVDGTNQLAPFSNFGDWVTSCAPGVDVPVAIGAEDYVNTRGTSVACAILAGVAALMLKANPSLRPAQVKAILQAVGPRALRDDPPQVAGALRVVDAAEAVRRAAATAGAPPPGSTS